MRSYENFTYEDLFGGGPKRLFTEAGDTNESSNNAALSKGLSAAIGGINGIGKTFGNVYTRGQANNINTQNKALIYGDSTDDPIGRLFSMKRDRERAVSNAAGSLQNFNTFDATSLAKQLSSSTELEKMGKAKFGEMLGDNLLASAQGAEHGAVGGPWGMLIGGIAGGLANFGSFFGRKDARDEYNNVVNAVNNQTDINKAQAYRNIGDYQRLMSSIDFV